jgi:hypothetical protein
MQKRMDSTISGDLLQLGVQSEAYIVYNKGSSLSSSKYRYIFVIRTRREVQDK